MKIGIYFKNYNWAKRYFNYLLETKDIVCTRKHNHGFFIQYANKNTVTFIIADDSSCGCRFDKIYLQDGIDLDTYRYIIVPTLLHRRQINTPIQVIKEQNNNYLFMAANEYYGFKKD